MKPEASLPALFIVVVLAGCAASAHSQRPTAESISEALAGRSGSRSTSRSRSPGASIADLAMQMLGVPYLYGGTDPQRGFDCSGLVYYAYAQTGISVPRTSQAQFDASHKISLEQAGAGDLVFFRDQEKLSHVGIYLGNGNFIHAPTSGRTVSVAELSNPYYRQHLIAVGRLVPN